MLVFMATRHVRSVFLSAALALLAVSGLIGLSGWHSAMVHDEDAIHAVVILHDHAASHRDPDAPLHALAHTVSQWVVHAGVTPLARMIDAPAIRWTIAMEDRLGGIAPATLLRPPRR